MCDVFAGESSFANSSKVFRSAPASIGKMSGTQSTHVYTGLHSDIEKKDFILDECIMQSEGVSVIEEGLCSLRKVFPQGGFLRLVIGKGMAALLRLEHVLTAEQCKIVSCLHVYAQFEWLARMAALQNCTTCNVCSFERDAAVDVRVTQDEAAVDLYVLQAEWAVYDRVPRICVLVAQDHLSVGTLFILVIGFVVFPVL